MNVIPCHPVTAPRRCMNFAEAAFALRSRTDLTPEKLAEYLSCLTSTARLLGCSAVDAYLDVEWLGDRLLKRSPEAFRIKTKPFRKHLTRVRAVLRLFGLYKIRSRSEDGLLTSWRDLLQQAKHPAQRPIIRNFAHYCTKLGLELEETTNAILSDYIDFDRRTSFGQNAGKRGGTLARALNAAIANGKAASGACNRFAAPARRIPYTKNFSHYPVSLQADISAFEARMNPRGGRSVTSQHSDGQRRSPATSKMRIFSLRQILAALVHKGHDPSRITSLSYLFEPVENAGDALDYFDELARMKLPVAEREDAVIAGGQIAIIADTLLIIARHIVGVTGESLRKLQQWRKRAHPRHQTGLTGKVRERLRRLIEPRTRSKLLVLSEDILGAARKSGKRDAKTARQVMFAVAIEILLVCPLRMKNLVGLRVDHHLQRISHNGKQITHIIIEDTETKNHEMVEWPVPPGTAKLLETWLKLWRPLLTGGDASNPYLFPRQGGRAMLQGTLANGLIRFVEHEVGVRIHPHLLRHFAAWRHLNRHPGQYEIVRRALGHKSVETTIKVYCGLEDEGAARVYHKGLDQDRVEARRLIQAMQQAKAKPGRCGKRVG